MTYATMPTAKPSYKTMIETLHRWHEESLNDPEYIWLNFNFEMMADEVTAAHRLAQEPNDDGEKCDPSHFVRREEAGHEGRAV